MRINSTITEIRRKVYTEVARLAYEGGDYKRIETLPYKIIPGEKANYRESVFLERAIIGERLRLSIGLPVRSYTQHVEIAEGIDESAIAEKYYDPPLINIIKFACNCCPEKLVKVTDICRGCLEHACTEVCPTKAVSMINRRSVIDQSKCIKCGKCVAACPYNAIVKQERPCAKACGVNAIKSDELGRADIDYNKCVSCGMCLVNCPFGAITDKGQIFQTIHAIKTGVKVFVALAPSFVSQFPGLAPEGVRDAFRQLGFADVMEVAVGADLCTIDEANDFMQKVPSKQPFMATSCCPAWISMAKSHFPELKDYISMTMTPMVLTGRLIKKRNPGCKVVFIGPCSAKKLEASRKWIRSDIDFVLTYAEVMGMFEAKGVKLDSVKAENTLNQASADGRGYAVGGGVANAVVNCIKENHPNAAVNVVKAEGLSDCRKMLLMAKAGKHNGCLLEGMACPGGCMGGAGTIQPTQKAADALDAYKKSAPLTNSNQSKYKEYLHELD